MNEQQIFEYLRDNLSLVIDEDGYMSNDNRVSVSLRLRRPDYEPGYGNPEFEILGSDSFRIPGAGRGGY